MTHPTELLRATARAAFWQNYEQQPDVVGNITFRATSDSDQETYPYTSAAPSPIEMSGSRTHKSVPEISYAIKNKKWESTVDISYEMWRYEKLNQVASLTGELGMKARNYYNKLVSTLMSTGDATAGPDGLYFYDTDHIDAGAAYSTIQSNIFDGVGATPTAMTDLEVATAMRGAIAMFYGFKDGQGDPVVPNPNTIFEVHVPAAVLTLFQKVETQELLTGGVSNDMKGRFKTVHNPWIDAWATTQEFFVHNTTGVRKPYVLQEAEAVSMEDNLGTESEKETKDRWVGSFGYYNVGYGDWRYSVQVPVTT